MEIISPPGDNIVVAIREIAGDNDSRLRAGQHVCAMDNSLYHGFPENQRTAFAATKIAWSTVAVELVINGAPSGVLCAERDQQDSTKMVVWFNDLANWTGRDDLTNAALEYARSLANHYGGILVTKKMVPQYTTV